LMTTTPPVPLRNLSVGAMHCAPHVGVPNALARDVHESCVRVCFLFFSGRLVGVVVVVAIGFGILFVQ